MSRTPMRSAMDGEGRRPIAQAFRQQTQPHPNTPEQNPASKFCDGLPARPSRGLQIGGAA